MHARRVVMPAAVSLSLLRPAAVTGWSRTKGFCAPARAGGGTDANRVHCSSLGMWNNRRSSQPSCCSQSSAHGGRAGSSMRTEIQFTAGKAPALSRTHLLFLLVVQLSDCCLHISSLLSTDDIAGKGVWNNLTVWELHANSIRLRIPTPH